MIASVLRKSKESQAVQDAFFTAEAERIVDCARAMVRAFEGGGRLYTFGNGGGACDAQHIAVEFMHPVFEKRPALPAASLTDTTFLTAVGNDDDFSLGFRRQLEVVARRGDVAIGVSSSGRSTNVLRAMEAARELELLTIGFSGRDGGRLKDACDFCFVVPSYSIHRIQETHQTLLHVLWDCVHVIRGEEDVI